MIQQIYDRVPTKPNRKKLTFESDGHVEYVTEEYADEPTIEGIPYNGFFASNLQGDLYTIDRSVLPDSVTLENGTVKMNIDLPLTSYETGKLIRLRCPTVSGTWDTNITFEQLGLQSVTASSNSSEVYRVIDGINSTYWHSDDNTEYQNVWWRMNFKSAIKINKMKIRVTAGGGTTYFASGKIQGSNNGTSWTDLYTLTASSTVEEITINPTLAYRYYRVLASATSSTRSIQIYEVQVTEYEGNANTLKNPQININTLGDKTINGLLYAGKDYLLRYSGSQWEIAEGVNIVSGTFGIVSGQTITVNLGFKPKLVILYSAGNNTSGVGTYSGNASETHVPIIISDQYNGGKVAVTSTGFTINETASINESILHYIAIGG